MYVNPRLYKINENSVHFYLAYILAFFLGLMRKCREQYAAALTCVKVIVGLQKIEAPPKDPTEEYIKQKKNKLLRTWEDEMINMKMNLNIDPVFYNKKELNEIMKIENNDIEKLWKTRILYEFTPRGSIVMFYDAFKQGFAYYSEQNGIPYSILNAVAMKYVITFFCRDFFMDEQTITLTENTETIDKINPRLSPLIKIYYEDDKDSNKDDIDKDDIDKDDVDKDVRKNANKELLKDAPFAKLKNYKLAISKDDNDTKNGVNDENNVEKPIKQLLKNKFISLGKIRDVSFIQKPPKQTCLPIMTTSFEGLFEVPTVNASIKKTTSYKDYKQKKITYKDYKANKSNVI
jgi:hypothetical protein